MVFLLSLTIQAHSLLAYSMVSCSALVFLRLFLNLLHFRISIRNVLSTLFTPLSNEENPIPHRVPYINFIVRGTTPSVKPNPPTFNSNLPRQPQPYTQIRRLHIHRISTTYVTNLALPVLLRHISRRLHYCYSRLVRLRLRRRRRRRRRRR